MIENRLRTPYDVELTHNQSGSNVSYGFIVSEQGGVLDYRQGLIPELSDTVRNDTFSGEHRSPVVDLPATFNRFDLGAGFEDYVDVGTLGFPGYNYTRGVDLSFGSRGYLAPEKQTGGSTTQAPLKFVKSELGLFCMTARYVLEWTGAAWTQRLDTGGTITNHDLVEFKTKVGTYLLLGVSDQGYYLSTNGTVWRQLSTTDATPSHRASEVATTTGASGLTPTEPSGAAENDVLVAVVVINADEAIIPPAGWSEITQQTLTGVTARAAIFWIRRGGSAPSYAFTWTTSTRAAVAVSAYQSVYPTGSPFLPFTSSNFNINASGTSHSTGTATVTWTKQAALAIFAGSDGASTGPGAWTAPAGYAENADPTSAPGVETAIDATTTEGALSAATATSANACVSLGALLILRPTMTGAIDVARFAARGSSSGESVLWALDTYGDLRNCTDPTNRSSWSAGDSTQLGPQQVNIAGIEVINNVFYLVHDGGITSYDGTTVKTVWEALTLRLAADNARPAVGPDNRLYLAFGGTLLRLDTDQLVLERVWPRGPQIGNPELNGTITAITFDEGRGYFALKNSAGNYYVMKFDPSLSASIGDESVTPAHTFYYNGNAAIGALLITGASADAFSSTNPQLVMGDATTADYLIMPKPGLRPEDDSACRFEAASNQTAVGSFIDFRAQAFPKWLTRGDVEVTDADSDDTVAIQYQTVDGSATTITSANSNGRTTATLNSEVAFTKIRPLFVFNNGANTTTPVLLGGVLHAAPNAPRDRYWSFVAKVAENQLLRNGLTQTRFDAEASVEFLMNARNEYVTFKDMKGGSHNVKVLDVEPVLTRFSADMALEEHYRVTLVELVS